MAFSATDAAFEGFRIAREKPLAILIWALAAIVIASLTAFAMVQLVGPDMAEIMAIGQTPSDDPAAAMAMLPKLGKLYGAILPLALVTAALFTCAVYRVVLRPEERGLGYLKVGGDELRILLLFLVLTVLWIGGAIAASVALGVLAAVLGAVAPVAGGALVLLGVVALVLVSVWIFVRLSLAGPMTFSERRLIVFGSWRVTKGEFWNLLGAYLLAFVLGVIVSLLGMVIYIAVASAVAGGFAAASQVFQADMSSLEAYFTPAMIVYLLFSGVLSALYYAIVYAPAAVIWRELKAQGVSA